MPTAGASNYPLYGVGTYVDLKLYRWVQIEGEARWMRWNQFNGIHQDNYLIGPRLPIRRFGKMTLYGKALVGFSQMTFDPVGSHGRFTDYAFGGGADMKISKRLKLRLVDVEYQYWPSWGDSSTSPYGASVGLSYKVF